MDLPEIERSNILQCSKWEDEVRRTFNSCLPVLIHDILSNKAEGLICIKTLYSYRLNGDLRV